MLSALSIRKDALFISKKEAIKAAARGDLALIQRYMTAHIHHPAKINAKYQGQTALLAATINNHLAIVSALLSVPGIDVNAQTYDFFSLEACYSGEFRKNTALMCASHQGNTSIVTALLATPGININLQNDIGDTALMLATKKGHLAIVNALLAMPGIQINIKNNMKDTALTYAVMHGHTGVVKALLNQPNIDINHLADYQDRSALMFAAEQDNCTIVKDLLAMPHININDKNSLESTALIIAAKHGHVNVAKILLSSQAMNINMKDSLGDTALIRAIENEHQEMAHLLIDNKKSDLDITNKEGNTALLIAIRKQQITIVKKLLDAGADITIVNSKGETASTLATQEKTLRTMFRKQSIAKEKLKTFLESIEKEASENHESPESEQHHIQTLVDTSFAAISTSIQFIMKNYHYVEHHDVSKNVLFDLSSFLSILALNYSNDEEMKLELDKAAHQVWKITELMGHSQAKNIIKQFKNITQDDERKFLPFERLRFTRPASPKNLDVEDKITLDTPKPRQ